MSDKDDKDALIEQLQDKLELQRKQMEKEGLHDRYRDEFFVEPDGTENYDKYNTGKWKPGKSPGAKSTQWSSETRPRGGRPKGSKNKKTLRQQLKDQGDLTPAEFLTTIMNDESQNMKTRMQAAMSAAPYYDAKLASTELHTDEDRNAPFQIVLNQEAGGGDIEICEVCEQTPCECDLDED